MKSSAILVAALMLIGCDGDKIKRAEEMADMYKGHLDSCQGYLDSCHGIVEDWNKMYDDLDKELAACDEKLETYGINDLEYYKQGYEDCVGALEGKPLQNYVEKLICGINEALYDSCEIALDICQTRSN